LRRFFGGGAVGRKRGADKTDVDGHFADRDFVVGVFLARLPALVLGTSSGRADVQRAAQLRLYVRVQRC
jgi:hypothetical protein